MSRVVMILSTIVVVLACALMACIKTFKSQRDDIMRLKSNQSALMDTITNYKCLDGLNAHQIKRLEMTKKEFKETNNLLKSEVENMKIKIRRLQSADRVGTTTEYIFKPDTIYIQQQNEQYQAYTYQDPWLTFTMDTAGVKITSSDTIYVVRHQKVRRFLFWVRRRDKYITVENRNPHTHVTTIESIDLN